MANEHLLKTKFEQVVAAIEHVHYEHTVDAGAMWGTLTAQEAKSEYTKLLNMLPNIPDLTPEEKTQLAEMINKKIAEIPAVERQMQENAEQYEVLKHDAFEEAKKRFSKLSKFEQLQLRQLKKDPESIDKDWLSLQEIRELYRKKM